MGSDRLICAHGYVGAGFHLTRRISRILVIAECELRPAASIHPKCLAGVAPAIAFLALGAAAQFAKERHAVRLVSARGSCSRKLGGT
jgi:hypothetical protein